MDLFQLNIYTNPLAYPFIIRSIKNFLNNNNLSIKKEGNLSINTYPKVSLEKHIMFETSYKKDEVKKICSKLPEFINQYNAYHPSNLELDMDLIDIKSKSEFQKAKPKIFKQIKWILLITLFSFLIGYLAANLKIQTVASIHNTVLEVEEVKTPQEFAIGLSKYKSISNNSAMLFDFKKETNQTFWMKNMSFPIDIIFLDKNNIILDIHSNQSPCPLNGDCPEITSKHPYWKVIETRANFAAQNSLKTGEQFAISKNLNFID